MMFEKLNNFIKRVIKADIVQVFSLTSLSTLVKMLTGFVSIKIVAVIIGPAGIALLGQLNNFIQIIQTLSQGGVNNGVTKYISEYREDQPTIKRLISTAFRFTIYCTIVCGVICVTLSKVLAQYILLDVGYSYIFIILGCFLFLFSLNALIISIINGFELYKKFIWVNILNAVIGVIYTVSLVLLFGLTGALIGVVTFQSIMLFVTIIMVRKLGWFNKQYWCEKIDYEILKKYLRYSAMTFISIAIIPVTQLILRSYVMVEISEIEAGWWEAMNRLSSVYLMVITSSFAVYYLPRLSSLTDDASLRAEVFKAAKFILPLLVIGLSFIYLLRIFIIKVLFSVDFMPMQNLFIWQLLGDFFKIASWLLAFVMVAKAQMKRFIITEVVFGIIYLLGALTAVNFSGSVVGLVQAYALNYVMYCVAMVILFRKLIFK